MRDTAAMKRESVMNTSPNNFRDNRGSVLIVAVIFATIAAISLGSYVRMAGAEMRLANTQFYSNASLNLAEAGIEEALFAINQDAWSEQNWGQGPRSVDRQKRFEPVDLGSGATGEFVVRVEDYNTFEPTVIAEGTVTAAGRTTSKQIEAKLQRRSYFGNGITSRSTIIIRGNRAYIASYRSSIPETLINDLDNGSIASVLVIDESIDIGNATIRGWVATGGGDPVWRNNATVGSHDTPDGEIDESRISRDFSSSFPEVERPDTMSYLPYLGIDEPVGIPGESTYYVADNVNVSGSGSELVIQGHVTMVVDNDFNIGGNGTVTIEENSSLTLYVGGDLSVKGNGIANQPGYPANLQIYGFGDAPSEFDLGGTADLFAAVYAPNANIDMLGTSEFRGAVVGNEVFLNGNMDFWYDEDLQELFTDDRYAMSRWRELYGAARHDLNGDS